MAREDDRGEGKGGIGDRVGEDERRRGKDQVEVEGTEAGGRTSQVGIKDR